MVMLGPRRRTKLLPLSFMDDPAPLMRYKHLNASGAVVLSHNWNGTGNPKSIHYVKTSDEVHPGPPYRSGGPFASIRVLVPLRLKQGIGSWRAGPINNHIYTLEGGFAYPDISKDQISYNQYLNMGIVAPDDVSRFPNLSPWGPKAYAKLRPQLEKAGLSLFLREARDIPRMIRTTSRGFHDLWKNLGGKSDTAFMHPKKVADHFLNHQFGWAPFVGDLIKLDDAYRNSQKYISQLVRDNNSWVRRTRTLAHTETSVKIHSQPGLGCEPVKAEMSDFMDFSGGGHWDLHKEETSVVWGTGSFKYYRPEFDPSLETFDTNFSDVQRLATLYGLRVNPSVVYKAMPWSWLIDWFSNVGDQIDLANDWGSDGIVSKYMYVMQSRVTHLRSYHYVPWFKGRSVLSWDRMIHTKQREPASSSYGFELTDDMLSLRQLGILSALGLSRRG